MEKYKICPNCGRHNSPLLTECEECEEDLQNVEITDEETEKRKSIDNSQSDSLSTGKMIRICDECGAKNPANANKCVSCGEDISTVLRTKDIQEDTKRYILSSLDGSYKYEISEDNIIIGREKEMKEYLITKSYVSREHAVLSINENKLFVENLSKTNYTFINNKKINDGEKIELKDGDELQFGGLVVDGSRQELAAYFHIKIESCF